MNLYIVRHGEAVPVGGSITRDADRPLSRNGEEDSRLTGKALARIDPGIAVILTSPLIRAVQTGELIGREISNHPAYHVTDNLSPGFSWDTLLEEIVEITAGGNAVAVGHQPDLGMFVSYLISESAHVSLSLKPCSVAGIRLEVSASRRDAHLALLLNPAVVRALNLQL